MLQPPAYAQALATALPALPIADAPRSEPAHARASTAPTAGDLPDYSAVPRLRAENLFWWGFALCVDIKDCTDPTVRCSGSSARRA